MSASALTADRLRELLSYDPETGDFVWLVSPRRNVAAGTLAGSVHSKGYLHIRVDCGLYLSHRLARLYVTGEWPAALVDHRDGDKRNNRYSNLRDATTQTNKQNTRHAYKNNLSSGLLGVSLDRKSGKWRAYIQVPKGDGTKKKHLGFYDCPKVAHEAYVAAKRQLHAGCTI